jgi:hypothetical protein
MARETYVIRGQTNLGELMLEQHPHLYDACASIILPMENTRSWILSGVDSFGKK